MRKILTPSPLFKNNLSNVVNYVSIGNFCSIVNMASVRGHNGMPKGWTYSATKGAILTMTRCMANDLRDKDIRVNSVSPSTIWTNAVSRFHIQMGFSLVTKSGLMPLITVFLVTFIWVHVL